MGRETPWPSPEEIARAEKQRTIKEAELLEEGAEYKVDKDGNKKLEVTKGRIEEARKEMERAPEERAVQEKIEKDARTLDEIARSINDFLSKEKIDEEKIADFVNQDFKVSIGVLVHGGTKGMKAWKLIATKDFDDEELPKKIEILKEVAILLRDSTSSSKVRK